MMIVVVVGRFYFIEMLGIQDIIIIIIIIIVMKQQIPRAKGKATQHIFSTKTVSNHEYWFST
jgi:hypothetical protein